MDQKLRLSVIISTHHGGKVLERCRQSLLRQELNSLDFEIIEIQGSRTLNRFSQYSKARGPFLLFLDEDVELPHSRYLIDLLSLVESKNFCGVVGGTYQNAEGASYRTRAYNSICSNWVRRGLGVPTTKKMRQTINVLGGVFCAPKAIFEKIDFIHSPVWGGEDTFLFRKLTEIEVPLYYCSDLDVIHNDKGSILKWMRRAYLHGLHKAQFNLDSIVFNFEWRLVRDIAAYFPYYLLHFFGVYVGVATAPIHTALLSHKKNVLPNSLKK